MSTPGRPLFIIFCEYAQTGNISKGNRRVLVWQVGVKKGGINRVMNEEVSASGI